MVYLLVNLLWTFRLDDMRQQGLTAKIFPIKVGKNLAQNPQNYIHAHAGTYLFHPFILTQETCLSDHLIRPRYHNVHALPSSNLKPRNELGQGSTTQAFPYHLLNWGLT